MRLRRIIQIIASVICVVIGLIWFMAITSESHYTRLQYKGSKYYATLAAACDSVLEKHPVGTNEVIWISTNDLSLPPAIKNLHPIKLNVSSNCVWMLLDSNSRTGIGLAWEQRWDSTNIWTLDITAEGMETSLYSTTQNLASAKTLKTKR